MMCHPRYCLTYHPGISSATQTSHLSAPPTLPTLASNPRHPHQDVTHASTPPTLACHSRQHATNANTPPTLAGLQRKHTTYVTHVSVKSMLFLKLLGIQLALRFQGKIQQFLLSVFIFTLYFLGLLHRIQRKLVCLIQNTTIFSKTNA